MSRHTTAASLLFFFLGSGHLEMPNTPAFAPFTRAPVAQANEKESLVYLNFATGPVNGRECIVAEIPPSYELKPLVESLTSHPSKFLERAKIKFGDRARFVCTAAPYGTDGNSVGRIMRDGEIIARGTYSATCLASTDSGLQIGPDSVEFWNKIQGSSAVGGLIGSYYYHREQAYLYAPRLCFVLGEYHNYVILTEGSIPAIQEDMQKLGKDVVFGDGGDERFLYAQKQNKQWYLIKGNRYAHVKSAWVGVQRVDVKKQYKNKH